MRNRWWAASGVVLGLLLFSALPARAGITTVSFKTTRNVSFYWGSAISNLLRSQDGVEQVEEAYANLKHGLIKVKTRADKKIDLAQLVRVLEKDVGFEPVTAVTLELRGRLQRREGKLFFEAAESGQTFVVESVEGGTENLPDASLPIVATLVDPHAADRIALRRPKMESGRQPPASGENATARLSISGMTWAGCAGAVRAALMEMKGVREAKVDLAAAEARVTYDPAKVRPEQLPEALQGTRFKASLKSVEQR